MTFCYTYRLIIFIIIYQLFSSDGLKSSFEHNIESKTVSSKRPQEKPEEVENDEDSDDDAIIDYKTKLNSKRTGPRVWDRWGKWSSCSVSCGIGRMTRWRHCVSGGCAAGEKEAQIRTCTLPAC